VHRQENPSAQINKVEQKRAAFKSVGTECSKERLQEAAVPAESRAIRPLDKSSEGRVARLTGPREMLVKSQKEIVDHTDDQRKLWLARLKGSRRSSNQPTDVF